MTVMFERTDVLQVGNYQEWFWNEECYLWIRIALRGQKFANCRKLISRFTFIINSEKRVVVQKLLPINPKMGV